MVFEKRLLDITCKVIYPSCFRVFLKHSAITAFHSDFVVLCSHSVFLGKQVSGDSRPLPGSPRVGGRDCVLAGLDLAFVESFKDGLILLVTLGASV